MSKFEESKEYKEALGSWVSELRDWNYLLTLTFADKNGIDGYKVGMQRSGRAARGFTRQGSALGIDAFLVEERGDLQGRLHWHGLLSAHEREDPADNDAKLELRLSWLTKDWENRQGFVKLDLLRSVEAGVKYVTKYMTKGFQCGRFVTTLENLEVA